MSGLFHVLWPRTFELVPFYVAAILCLEPSCLHLGRSDCVLGVDGASGVVASSCLSPSHRRHQRPKAVGESE